MFNTNNLGLTIPNNTKFNAEPVSINKLSKISEDDKKKIKTIAKTQMGIGSVAVGSTLLAGASPFIKNKTCKTVAVIPASFISLALGSNMIANASKIKNIVNQADTCKLNKNA